MFGQATWFHKDLWRRHHGLSASTWFHAPSPPISLKPCSSQHATSDNEIMNKKLKVANGVLKEIDYKPRWIVRRSGVEWSEVVRDGLEQSLSKEEC